MLLAVALGLVGGVGAALAVSGWRPVPTRTARGSGSGRGPRLEPAGLLAPVAVGIVALAVTRWPVAGVIAALAARVLVNRSHLRVDEASRAEAIALLIEQLKNAAGAADGVETVLANAARHAPVPIRGDIERGIARLAYAPLEVVLDDLAEALAHPSGDQVARAIAQVAAHGGSLQGALDRLSRRTQALAEMHRRIEVAREQPRSTMRTVTVVIAGFTVLLFVGARDWMSAYGTLAGQLVLLAIAAWFAFWLQYMGRLARIAPVERFYAKGDGFRVSEGSAGSNSRVGGR